MAHTKRSGKVSEQNPNSIYLPNTHLVFYAYINLFDSYSQC